MCLVTAISHFHAAPANPHPDRTPACTLRYRLTPEVQTIAVGLIRPGIGWEGLAD